MIGRSQEDIQQQFDAALQHQVGPSVAIIRRQPRAHATALAPVPLVQDLPPSCLLLARTHTHTHTHLFCVFSLHPLPPWSPADYFRSIHNVLLR